jgi:hypothetical protein
MWWFSFWRKAKARLGQQSTGSCRSSRNATELYSEHSSSGRVGAITFDPPHTDIAVRLVHTQEEKTTYLENVSDSELQYCLYYREEFAADGAEIKTERLVELSYTMRIPQRKSSSTASTGANHNGF